LPPKKKRFNVSKEVKAIARERVGTIPAAKLLDVARSPKKPKHKKPIAEETE
jgi:hypothetical protein